VLQPEAAGRRHPAESDTLVLRELLAQGEREEEMIEILALIWAVSASISLEAHEAMPKSSRNWTWQIIAGALCPIYNTLVAVAYVQHILNEE
jgi:hypothetical protein